MKFIPKGVMDRASARGASQQPFGSIHKTSKCFSLFSRVYEGRLETRKLRYLGVPKIKIKIMESELSPLNDTTLVQVFGSNKMFRLGFNLVSVLISL